MKREFKMPKAKFGQSFCAIIIPGKDGRSGLHRHPSWLDCGATGWGGPCPPKGNKAHRYNFTVYALKVEKLELPANPTASLTGFMVNANSLGKASFTARYGR